MVRSDRGRTSSKMAPPNSSNVGPTGRQQHSTWPAPTAQNGPLV